MTIRIVFIGAMLLIASGSPALAQGRPGQQVVISAAVVKAMAASKPKAKSPLITRLGNVRKPDGAATSSEPAAPTSVGEIRRKAPQ